MKIHVPSLGLGIGIAGIVIFIIFIASSSGFFANSVNNTEKAQNNESQNFQMTLLSENASPVLGSKEAPITMIEFGDYQCFYCNKFYHETESDIVKNFVDNGKVKIVFKDFTIIGQDSVTAANAAHCAEEQGKFWQYHDTLYDHWNGENTGWASSTNLLSFAQQIGLASSDFNSCMSDSRYASTVKGSLTDAQTLGLTGTPDFFIIGKDNSVTKIVGAQPYEVFDEIFKSKLKT